MGSWSVESVSPDIRLRNDVYGHFFAIRFRLKYKPSTMGSFQEMPRLEWKETITMMEANEGTWWQYVGDQYERNPGSMTFNSWVGRYSFAHYSVCRKDARYGNDEPVRLYDSKGGELDRDTFDAKESSQEAQADAVRAYLKKNGGIMELIVVDKPGINKPTDDTTFHKERILTFDCGLRGVGERVKAYQHLIVSGALPENQWTRECVLSNITPPLQTGGLRKIDPPDDVTIVKPFDGGPKKGTYL
jgi:hypothetical protein